MLTRRRFLAGVAATAAGLLLPDAAAVALVVPERRYWRLDGTMLTGFDGWQSLPDDADDFDPSFLPTHWSERLYAYSLQISWGPGNDNERLAVLAHEEGRLYQRLCADMRHCGAPKEAIPPPTALSMVTTIRDGYLREIFSYAPWAARPARSPRGYPTATAPA